MITKCFNAACYTPFDYRAGRLVRFSRRNASDDQKEDGTFIEHFWLCEVCAELYEFDCEPGMPVGLRRRKQAASIKNVPWLVSAA